MLQKYIFDIILGEVDEEDKKLAYRNIILEVPPKGSRFLKNRGYITPDREYITREMREKVLEIRLEYYTIVQKIIKRNSNPKTLQKFGNSLSNSR